MPRNYAHILNQSSDSEQLAATVLHEKLCTPLATAAIEAEDTQFQL